MEKAPTREIGMVTYDLHTYLTYNQEKAIVAAFSVIVKSLRTFI